MPGAEDHGFALIGRPLPWSESFAVGDERMDREHRDLLKVANEVCQLMVRGGGIVQARAGICELVAAMEAHFLSEEALFPTIGYPQAAEHRQTHEDFRLKLGEMLSRTHSSSHLAHCAEAMRVALVEHLVREDLGYKTYVLRRAGL